MMKKVLVMLAVLGLAAAAQAVLIDDFEGYALGNVRDVASPPWTAVDNTGQADIFDDGTGNQVLGFGWNSGWRGTYNDTIVPVADTSIAATLFMRLYANHEDLDHSVGLADVPGAEINWFDDFEIQVAVTRNDTAGTVDLKGRNAGNVDFLALLNTGQWYNVWVVIDQTADVYDLYLTTGTAEATAADQVGFDLAFRNGTTDALTAFVGCGYYAGGQQDLWVDDIYLTEGVDLSNPIPEPASLLLLGLGGLLLRKRS